VSTIPIGRIGQSEEIAKAALFPASDDSSETLCGKQAAPRLDRTNDRVY